MIKKKSYDGVVVAVHFNPQGEIEWVRAFERSGFVFSDRVTMDRQKLVEQLREGKRYKTGVRKTYQGNDFKIIEDIRFVENDAAGVIIVGNTSSNKDSLGNIPVI